MLMPETIAALQRGTAQGIGWLFFMDFKSGPQWAWSGTGPLTTADGRVWQGVGDVLSVSGGEYAVGSESGNMQITVRAKRDSLSDPVMRAVARSESEIYGRSCFAAIQFFDRNMQCTDRYQIYFIGFMDQATAKVSAGEREIVLNVESPLMFLAHHPVEFYSDRDQRLRDVDDGSFKHVSATRTKQIQWPVFN